VSDQREYGYPLIRLSDEWPPESYLSLHRTLEGAKAAAEQDWKERFWIEEDGSWTDSMGPLEWVEGDRGWVAAWDPATYLTIGETAEYRVEQWPVEE
jgi:hypothetical protein